jgi:hypothetical protein
MSKTVLFFTVGLFGMASGCGTALAQAERPSIWSGAYVGIGASRDFIALNKQVTTSEFVFKR